MNPRALNADLFWKKVDMRGPDECWPWLAAKSSSGYGVFEGHGAYRVALALATGGDQPGMQAMHSCHNRECVNPAHLSWGTGKQNLRDMVAAGRCRNARITPQQALEIRAERQAGARLKEIGARYGLSESAVSRICAGITWRISDVEVA